MRKNDGYERNIASTGPQEVSALKKSAKTVKKGTAVRGRDLRSK